MQKTVGFGLEEYAGSIEQAAFLSVAYYERTCSEIDRELPPGQHTRLMPEVVCFKPGRIQILWTIKKHNKSTGKIYYKREWPHHQGKYPSWQLKEIAHPSEFKLALKTERDFVRLREASTTMTTLKKAAKRLDEIARLLSPRIRDLYKKCQGHNYGGNVEKILKGLYEDPDIWEDLSERTDWDET